MQNLIRSASLFLLIGAIQIFSACGNLSPHTGLRARGTPTGCVNGAALIGVYDNFMETICGCAEGAVRTLPGGTLNCTVSSRDSVVVFQFFTRNQRQVLSTGTPRFMSSPQKDQKDLTPIHAQIFPGAGTYSFTIPQIPNLNGNVIVP